VQKRLAPLVAVLALVACGGASTTAEKRSVDAYFYRGARLVPVRVGVSTTGSAPAAALRALLAGPPAGYTTAIPPGARLLRLVVDGGVATTTFSGELAELDRRGQAQLVYTLTQFPSVTGVRQPGIGRRSFVSLQDWTGESLDSPATRRDYSDMTPAAPIFVETPIRESTVTSPVRLAGTASVFEANVVVDVYTASGRIHHGFVTATAGAPERGRFSTSLTLPPGRANIVLTEPSAADGSVHYMTEVGVTVKP
jgi:hypothetical protein